MRTREEVFPICTCLVSPVFFFFFFFPLYLADRGKAAYQEDDGDVETKGNHGVAQQGQDTGLVDVLHGHVWDLGDQGDEGVHDSADGSKVVQRHQRVHLVLGRAEQTLDHDEPGSFEHDTADLEEEADGDKVDFTKGSDDDTDDDEGHVHENTHIWRGHSEGPGSEEDSYGSGGLCDKLERVGADGWCRLVTLSIWMKETLR